MIHITDKNIDQRADTVVTLGNFDGLHLGHQVLINTAIVDAGSNIAGGKSVAVSFFPHPRSVLKDKLFQTVLSSPEKAFLLEEMGLDVFVEYPFDSEIAALDAERFVSEILVAQLRCKELVVGEGYRFGKGGRGDCRLLQSCAERYGFTVKIIPHLMAGSEKISSTAVREEIARVRFGEAEQLMGRPYFIMGEVIHGNRLGSAINAPTANIRPPEYKLLPRPGVYSTKINYSGKLYRGMTNVGTRPTVGDSAVKFVETHLLDFDGDLYGQLLTVEFCEWVRDEKKFNDIDELKAQIMRDIHRAGER